jgi:uncharacterized membrane protein
LTDQVHSFVDQLAKALELAGVAIIADSIIVATLRFIRDGMRTTDWQSAFPRCRSNIGRDILLGLELLVGADVISTITAPLTFESVGLLAGIVLIRTFLSFSLETETEGCWPWQRAAKDADQSVVDRRWVSDCTANLFLQIQTICRFGILIQRSARSDSIVADQLHSGTFATRSCLYMSAVT